MDDAAPGYLALDVGGTKVAAGVVGPGGQVRSHLRAETATLRRNGDPLSAIVRLGREAMAAAGAEGVVALGIGLPGPVAREGIRMLAAPTIPEIEGVALEPILSQAFGCPAAGDNDGNACALAESRFGAGRGFSHVVYVTVSTGIGGGIVQEGRLLRGASGTSAEFGHQVILPEGGLPCDCGGYGCLETLASGRGIAARAAVLFEGPGWTAERALESARAGDPRGLQLWRDTALYLGAGLSNLINILDPEVIVLGGGVGTGAADLLIPLVREVIEVRCMPSLRRRVRIVPAGLGAEVGLVGAACLGMESRAAEEP